jgi:hypothetical protein
MNLHWVIQKFLMGAVAIIILLLAIFGIFLLVNEKEVDASFSFVSLNIKRVSFAFGELVPERIQCNHNTTTAVIYLRALFAAKLGNYHYGDFGCFAKFDKNTLLQVEAANFCPNSTIPETPFFNCFIPGTPLLSLSY